MNKIKHFFGIESGYKFEWGDINSLLTLLNVMLIICDWHYAPVIGIANCAIGLVLDVINHAHVNLYTTHIALIVMNIYFLM